MSPAKRIQYLHLALLAWFVALCCEAFWWRALPGWADIVGVAALHLGLWGEGRAMRSLLAPYGDQLPARTRMAARSMMMTRLLIGALSVVVIAAAVGRLGR